MEVKVHWIIDGIAEMDVETLEEAEQKVDEVLRALIADNKELVELLGARAIQGKAYLPGSEDDIESKEDCPPVFSCQWHCAYDHGRCRPGRRRWPDLQIAK